MTTQQVPAWYKPAAAENMGNNSKSGCLLVTVMIDQLVDLLDPLQADPWSVGSVTPDQVEAALCEGRLRPANPGWHGDLDVMVDSNAHAERIAWLVHHGWDTSTEALQLEVDEHGGASLHDGNHRLYALAFLGLRGPIIVELSGYLDIAETLFNVAIP